MPAENRWYAFTRPNIEKIPKGRIGAYLLGNKDKTPLRPGKSSDLRSRLMTHLIHNAFPTAKYFKFLYAFDIQDAERIERETFYYQMRKHPRMKEKTIRIPHEHKRTPFD
jgi:hypothetical protein